MGNSEYIVIYCFSDGIIHTKDNTKRGPTTDARKGYSSISIRHGMQLQAFENGFLKILHFVDSLPVYYLANGKELY